MVAETMNNGLNSSHADAQRLRMFSFRVKQSDSAIHSGSELSFLSKLLYENNYSHELSFSY